MESWNKRVLRVVFGVFCLFVCLFVYLFIYLFIYYFISEIHSPFSERPEVDLHMTG